MKIPEITYLNRLNDVFFKSLLGSEERKALTLNFINSILERDENNAFIDLIFADKEVVPQRIHGKLSLLDVLAEIMMERAFILKYKCYWMNIWLIVRCIIGDEYTVENWKRENRISTCDLLLRLIC